jgi:transcription antitermination protein NusB
MASRRKSRELALQMLFQWEVGKHTPAHVVATFLKPKEVEAPENTFARELFQGTVDQISALDPMLSRHASHWRLERMAAVDRNIIRLALFEMLHHPQTGHAVIINEALEIARRFSGEESAQFVNGVLDAIRKAIPAPSGTAAEKSVPASTNSSTHIKPTRRHGKSRKKQE